MTAVALRYPTTTTLLCGIGSGLIALEAGVRLTRDVFSMAFGANPTIEEDEHRLWRIIQNLAIAIFFGLCAANLIPTQLGFLLFFLQAAFISRVKPLKHLELPKFLTTRLVTEAFKRTARCIA